MNKEKVGTQLGQIRPNEARLDTLHTGQGLRRHMEHSDKGDMKCGTQEKHRADMGTQAKQRLRRTLREGEQRSVRTKENRNHE